ncbi:MAG: DUF1232 domain-containing protein [Erysipelotrichia bacterium]|nr:DUF1232 domain-containing protein [Erysipelotrichia bacterium]
MNDKGPSIPRQLLARPMLQFVLFFITVIYVVSPIDVVPDIMPLVGWLDDLAVFLAQISAFVVYLQEKRRETAQKQQHKNQD